MTERALTFIWSKGMSTMSTTTKIVSKAMKVFFYRVTHFFQHHDKKDDDDDEEKPDFITTFDILKLLDEQYAMQQFYCVINEDPCDEVGMRLKATIPEEINRNCERCTSTESSNIRRILNYVKKHYPQFWKRVEPIYKNKTTA